MTTPANDPDKPSPADTPTDRPNDNGGESKVRKEDKRYDAVDGDKAQSEVKSRSGLK